MQANSITDALLDFVITQEGERFEAYLDTGGVWTIGVGCTRHDGHAVHKGETCTWEQSRAWLRHDLQSAANAVNRLVQTAITPNMFAALVSFTFNVGEHALETSTLLRLLNAGHPDLASREFSRWDHDNGRVVAGLTARRAAERHLFLS